MWRFLRSAATGVLLVVVAIGLFEAMGAYFRHEPAGLGHPYRQGAAYRRFIDAPWVGFLTPYGVIAALAGGLECIANRRVDGGTAVLTTAAVLLFILLTLPLAEFLNACFLGESFFLRFSC